MAVRDGHAMALEVVSGMSLLQMKAHGLSSRLVGGLSLVCAGLDGRAVCHRWCLRRSCSVPVKHYAASKRITVRCRAICQVSVRATTIRPGNRH